METVFRDYRDKGVQFYYVYKSVQHPEINNFVSAFSITERLKHIAEAKRLMKTEIPWICDSMDNQIKSAFGGPPNGEFVIDPDGVIVRKRFWSNPRILRQDLEKLVGPVERITTVSDLPTKMVVEPRKIASGVVARIELPAGLTPLKTTPRPDEKHPFFAKLRAEATRSLLSKGKGKLYLGIYLDPLYRVHWNNRAGGVSVGIEARSGIQLSKTEMGSPKVAEDSDVDPRQFLINVERGDSKGPLEIVVRYTVCDDDDTFCKQVIQHYQVRFQPDRNLGSRPGIFMPEMFAKVREFDVNGDGDLTKDELPPGQVTLYIGHMDYNGNEIIEKSEIETFLSMFNNGRGFDSDLNDGGE